MGTATISAAGVERNITLLPGTDLPGFDYATIKGTDLASCTASWSI